MNKISKNILSSGSKSVIDKYLKISNKHLGIFFYQFEYFRTLSIIIKIMKQNSKNPKNSENFPLKGMNFILYTMKPKFYKRSNVNSTANSIRFFVYLGTEPVK